jgi:outer membrane protein assembly factor BamA
MLRKFLASTIIFLSIFNLFAAETQNLDHWWDGKPIREFVYIDLHEVTSQTIDAYTQPYLNKAYSEASMTKLKNDLLDLGLFIEVEMIPSRYEDSTDQLTLYIEFVEQQKLVDIVFKGNKVFTSDQLKEAIALKINTMFDTKVLSQDVQTIKRLYQNRGYDRLDVVPSYESDPKTDGIIVTYTLTEYEWYLNKPIKGFDYENLKNVAKDLIDDLTYSYIGKPFTQQLYRELEGKLNELGKFSLFQAEAKRGGSSNNDLYLLFKFTELPVIKSIAFENNAGIRTKVLEDNLDVKKGDFLSIQKVNSTKEDLIKLYKGRGYASIAIDVTYEIDEKTNLLELKYRITEGQQSKISEINFEGNENLSSSLLRKEISSKVQSLFNSGNYEEAKVHSDSQALQLAYQKRGFIDAEIDDVRLEEIESDKPEIKKLSLTFVINEGTLWYYGGLKVEGNSIYSDDEIYQLLTMKEGSVLNIEKVQQEIGVTR